MNKKKINWTAILFVAPNFLGFIVFILLPVIFSLFISFTDFNIFKGFKGTHFVGVKNYTATIGDTWFKAALINNFKYTIITIPIIIVISIIIATILNDQVFGQNAMRAIIFMPYIASVVAISTVWSMLYNPSQGIINQALKAIGVSNPPSWLGSPTWALPSIMIVGIWMGIGYNTIIYIAGLQGIDKSLYESADIDGANVIQAFFHITVPMLRSSTFFLIVTDIIASFQVFGTVNIMTGGGPGTSTTVMAHYIYLAGFRYHKMGYAAAIAWILLLLIFAVTVVQWKYQKRYENSM